MHTHTRTHTLFLSLTHTHTQKKKAPPSPQTANAFWEMWSDTELVHFTALLWNAENSLCPQRRTEAVKITSCFSDKNCIILSGRELALRFFPLDSPYNWSKCGINQITTFLLGSLMLNWANLRLWKRLLDGFFLLAQFPSCVSPFKISSLLLPQRSFWIFHPTERWAGGVEE